LGFIYILYKYPIGGAQSISITSEKPHAPINIY
jgi:hypothetical protein